MLLGVPGVIVILFPITLILNSDKGLPPIFTGVVLLPTASRIDKLSNTHLPISSYLSIKIVAVYWFYCLIKLKYKACHSGFRYEPVSELYAIPDKRSSTSMISFTAACIGEIFCTLIVRPVNPALPSLGSFRLLLLYNV